MHREASYGGARVSLNTRYFISSLCQMLYSSRRPVACTLRWWELPRVFAPEPTSGKGISGGSTRPIIIPVPPVSPAVTGTFYRHSRFCGVGFAYGPCALDPVKGQSDCPVLIGRGFPSCPFIQQDKKEKYLIVEMQRW